MKIGVAAVALLLGACSAEPAENDRYDLYLTRIIAAYDLRPLPTKPFAETPKFRLGQALFFDPVLSGNRDISCATCHIMARGLSDGLPASIGTGGSGLAEMRTLPESRPKQPRNAPDLWNRDNNSVKTMFWDGRAEVGRIHQAFPSALPAPMPAGFENLMAAQAIFPLTQADEMLGMSADVSSEDLPAPHGGQVNDFASMTVGLPDPERSKAILRFIVRRVVGGPGQQSMPWHAAYRKLFRDAYPEVAVPDISIVHVANALAHFEEIAFATRDAPWDKYLAGDHSAIGLEAKRGALLFYGKGRCAVCHSGPLFSDFNFHNAGMRDFDMAHPRDLGRFQVTGLAPDKYKFRTPPLRNVTLTAPYFHNGSETDLEEAIRVHLDPLRGAGKYDEGGGYVMDRDQIETIAPVLTLKAYLDSADIADLGAFLRSIEDPATKYVARIIPASVPSGLHVNRLTPAP